MTATNQRTGRIGQIPSEVVALLSALHLSRPDVEPLTRLRGEEWASLLGFCDIAHLTLPLAQLTHSRIPSWVAQRLQTNIADNARCFERVKATYSDVAEALRRANVDHIVIKGFTQAPDYVSDPRLRAQSDLDLYCLPATIGSARIALQSIGYRSDSMISSNRAADHDTIFIPPGNRVWKGNHFDPDISLGIELHFCLWNEPVSFFSIPSVEDFWHRRITRTIDNGFSFRCLNQVDHFGHLTLHILRNIFFGEWIIHHVYELAVFLQSHSEDDGFWKVWVETHCSSLRSIEAVALHFAHAWFGCNLHPQAEDALASMPPLQQQWLRAFAGSPLEGMFHHNKDFLWLHLSFVESPKKKLALLKRTLIPPRIASIDSPVVRVKKKRLRRTSESNRYWQYLVYLADRSASHSIASLSTLWRGLQWRLSQHQLARQFWIFLVVSFFFDLGLSTYFFLFNLFLIGHGYTEKTIGLIASAMAIGNLTGAIPAGRLARRFGLRPVLLSCFLLASAVFSARAILLPFAWQIPLAFLAGVALSAWAICVAPAVAQLTDERQRPFAFSLVFSLGIGVGALGGFIGSRLPGWFSSHQIPFRVIQPDQLVLLSSCGLVALGIWPVVKLNFKDIKLPARTKPFLSPSLLRFLIGIAVWSLVTGSFSPFANVFFAQHLHMSLPQIGNAFSMSQVVQVAAVLVAPFLLQRLGLIGGIVLTQLIAAALLVALSGTTHPLAATAAYVGFTAFQWMNEPGLYSLLMAMVAGDERSGASAYNSLVMSASQAVAVTLAGGAFVRYGYPLAMRSIAVIALIAAVLFWNMRTQPELEQAGELDTQTAN